MALFPPSWSRPHALRGRQATRYAREVPTRHREAEQTFRARWRDVAEGCGLARVVHVAAGVTVSVPRVGGVRLDHDGQVRSVTVQRHPGQTVADYVKAASLLADALDVAHLRVDDLGSERWMRLHLLDVDPLAESCAWSQRLPAGYIATTEQGRLLSCPWSRRGHTAIQGQTGSGKTSWLYSQLGPLAARRDVRVAGLDPSGLLWRPWPEDPWRVSGVVGDLAEHRRTLRELVRELDRRLASMDPDTDNLATDEATPLVVVVLEEYPGLIRSAELAGKPVLNEVRALVARLLAEGRKVGFRVVLAMQRADAATADALVRAQCGLRISFSVDSGEAVAFLHPRDAVDVAEHATAEPGVAILTAAGIGTQRVRAALIRYPEYAAAVRTGIQV